MRRSAPLLLVAALIGLLTTGCTIEDSICGGESYPVKAVDSLSGQDCVEKGQEPPAGFVRYPEGKEPKKVGDKWDLYWDEHKLDSSGREVSA